MLLAEAPHGWPEVPDSWGLGVHSSMRAWTRQGGANGSYIPALLEKAYIS